MNEIRQNLVEPSDKGYQVRKDAAMAGAVLQVGGTIGQALFAIITLVGLLSVGNYPKLGVFSVVKGAFGFILSREAFLVGKNLQNIMTSNIFERVLYAATAENFIQGLSKDTLILSTFSKTIALNLENPY